MLDEDAPEQTINVTGISAGGGESQPLQVTAVNSNTGLILDPTVDYTSPDSTGTLKFTPLADQSGTSTITVTVEDGGFDGNLGTADDNGTFSRDFVVNVGAVNFEHHNGALLLGLRESPQSVTITVTAEGLLLDLSPGTWFGRDTSAAGGHGTSRLTVPDASSFSSVNLVGDDSHSLVFKTPGDWRMGDTLMVEGRFLRSVETVVGGDKSILLDWSKLWQNPIQPSDVNNSGEVTAGDALVIINELARRAYSDEHTRDLHDPVSVPHWPGNYYDQNGDGDATALDALRVINEMARRANIQGASEVALLHHHLVQFSSNSVPAVEAVDDFATVLSIDSVDRALIARFDAPDVGQSPKQTNVTVTTAQESEPLNKRAVDEFLTTLGSASVAGTK